MEYEIKHIIGVTISSLGLHELKVMYDESDALAAVGAVSITTKSETRTCLGANTQLNVMWASPEGHLWVGADRGNIFTNAPVQFQDPPDKHLEYNSGFYDIEWQVTQTRLTHNHTCVWGTSDNDVWFLNFKGKGLHWDGQTFTEHDVFSAPNGMDGAASDDIYAVGWHGNIAHWNGKRWSSITPPEGIPEGEVFTDVRVVDRNTVYICGRNGDLLVGNVRDGFRDIGSPDYHWYGLGHFQNRLFLAAGPQGIYEYKNEGFEQLKDNIQAVGVFETDEALYFIPAEQQPHPWVARYVPGDPKPWMKFESKKR